MIVRIALTLEAEVPGLDAAQFQALAAKARRDCPLSRALAGVPEITLQATLRQGPQPLALAAGAPATGRDGV